MLINPAAGLQWGAKHWLKFQMRRQISSVRPITAAASISSIDPREMDIVAVDLDMKNAWGRRRHASHDTFMASQTSLTALTASPDDTFRHFPIFLATHVAFAGPKQTHPLGESLTTVTLSLTPMGIKRYETGSASRLAHGSLETGPIVSIADLVAQHPHGQKQLSQLVSSPRSC